MKRIYALLTFLLLVGTCLTFSACGDDEDDPIVNNGSDDSENGNGTDKGESALKSVVGRSFFYDDLYNLHGYQCFMRVTVKFTSATTCSLHKESTWYQWENMAYRFKSYDGTKTGTYSRVGNMLYFHGN